MVPADPDDVKAAGFSVYYTQEDISSLNPDNLPSHVGVRGFATGDLNVGDTMTAVLPDWNLKPTIMFLSMLMMLPVIAPRFLPVSLFKRVRTEFLSLLR